MIYDTAKLWEVVFAKRRFARIMVCCYCDAVRPCMIYNKTPVDMYAARKRRAKTKEETICAERRGEARSGEEGKTSSGDVRSGQETGQKARQGEERRGGGILGPSMTPL